MRLRFYRIPIFSLLTLLTVLVVSCTDDWNNHYYAEQASKSNLNLYQYIQAQTELSTFTKMLKITGYDTILNSSQTFTVWAPIDQSLVNVDLTDTALVTKIVTNNITRFSYPTSGIISKRILMLDNKLIVFAKGAGGYTFGGKTVIQSDVATKNGIIHMLSDYAPYRLNIWEFINKTDGIDSLRNYLNSLTITQIDTAASYKDGFFVSNVYKSTNKALTYLGKFYNEDSIYTAILPDNAAWSEAYNRILPYYKATDKDGGVSAQIVNTKWTLIQDLFFRGVKSLPIATDSIFSTYGNGFSNPNRLFAGSQVTEMSNGLSYITNQLKNVATDSWFKEIRIEAENPYNGIIKAYYSSTIESSIGTGYKVSKGYYLRVDPTTSSTISKPSVTFPIPNTLAAKYDIYCVFVPTSIIDATDVRPNKVKFYLSYLNNSGSQITNAAVDINNNVLAPNKAGAIFTTTPTSEVQEMLVVSGFQFPFANLVKQSDYISGLLPTVSLKIENAVNPNEQANFNRTLRIDCIILKPVQ